MTRSETDGRQRSEAEGSVTPYDVSGRVDYERLLDQFGADTLESETIGLFPDPIHPLLRRGFYYAGRDVERLLERVSAGAGLSIVTGIGPSGPLHLGHAVHLFLARYLQRAMDARVYIPISDDEKYWTSEQSLPALREIARDNIRDLIGMGFDPELTRIIVDSEDTDVLYPSAATFAGDLTTSQIAAIYGEPETVGVGFYPALQVSHLLLPQLLHGPHPTLVPVAIDQDPHVRVARDIAAKDRYPVEKPAALLGRFLPDLQGPGKMSSSSGDVIRLDDPPDRVEAAFAEAYSGGQDSVEAHRQKGGEPAEDVAFQYLKLAFEPSDHRLARLEHEYRQGDLLSGELKSIAADRVNEVLADHQRRRPEGPLSQFAEYQLTPTERDNIRSTILGEATLTA